MERWQKQYLTVNRAKLIEETTCNELLLSHLLSEGVLAKIDLESIRCKANRFEQAGVLYDIIETRKSGYIAMVKALGKVSQTGSQTIFMEGYARHAAPNLKINFLGKTQALNEMFTKVEIEKIINEIRNHLTVEQCIELYDQSERVNQCLVVMNDTIPAEIPFYIPRSLSRRVNVNPKVFQVDCADVFVFKGVDCSQLTKLVQPQVIAPSTSQLLTLSARFIFLEHDEDWEEISTLAKVPVHLIKHEKKDGGYLLEQSSGGSKMLNEYLEAERYDIDISSDSRNHEGNSVDRPANQNGSIKISEENFLETATTHGSRGVCICDLPGMGKSLLLANLATKMKHRHPEKLVFFIQLSLFSDVAVKKVRHVGRMDASVARNVLFEYVTPTPLACIFLKALVNNTATRFEVFLDGFDEVRSEHVSVTKQMMTIMANELPNVRIHVTSRPHMRLELEVTLKVISYDILPFSQSDQVNFLTNLWVKMDTRSNKKKLGEFAKYCIKTLRESLSSTEREITGIPLRCRLVADIFARNAIIFAKPDRNVPLKDVCTIEGSLPELYQRYMELCFSKIRAGVTRSDSTTSILYSPVQQARRMMEAIVGDNACLSDMQKVRDYHVFLALQTLFPELTDVLSKIFNFAEAIDEWKLFAVGILQKRFTGNFESVDFLHRTFAEFLVAEWFASVLNGELHHVPSTKGVVKKLTHFLFEKVIRTAGSGANFSPQFRFTYPVIVHFFNFVCAHRNVIHQNKFVNSEFVSCVSGGQLYRLLRCVLSVNYLNIFNLVNEILSRLDKFHLTLYKIKLEYCDREGFTELLNIAAERSSLALVKQLFQFSREYFDVDLDIVCGEMSPTKLDSFLRSPLHFSVERENHEIVQFFADRVPYDTSWILKIMVDLHKHTSPRKLKRVLIDIGTMLFERQSNLSRNVKIHVRGHKRVDAVKLLLKAERATPQCNVARKPLLHTSTECMDCEEFKELCRFFIEHGRGISVYEYKDGEWKCSLGEILLDPDIPDQGFDMIIGTSLRDSNDKMDQTSELLMRAAEGHRSLTFLKKLIEAGVDVMSKFDFGYTFAHTISQYYTPAEYHEIVKLLIDMQMGNAFRITNEYGATPLHFALERLEVLPETVELLAGRANASSPDAQNQTDTQFYSYANLNAIDARGQSLLHVATSGKKSLSLIKQLVELGADWTVKTKHNTNLVNLCSSFGLPDHLKYFVQLGCDVNELDNDGDNALQCVIFDASENVMEIVEFLLASGVRKENVNNEGKTAFDYAIKKGIKNARLLELLHCSAAI